MNNSYKIILAICSILLVVGLMVIFGVIQIKNETKRQEEIEIGAILPLTGSAASLGEQIRDGMLFAVANVNFEGGINGRKLKLLYEDGQGDPKISINAFMKLVKVNQIKIIVANLSNVALSLLPLVENNKVILFADAAHPEITGKSKYVFRHSHTASQEAKVIGEFSIDKLNSSNIVVSVMNDDYGVAFEKEIVNYFGYRDRKKILKNIFNFDKDEKDFTSLTTKILADRPDTIVIAGFEEGPGRIVRRLKELGYRGNIIGTIAFSTPSARNAAGDAAIGVYHPIYDMRLEDQNFENKSLEFFKYFNKKLTPFSILGYNTISLISKALRETDSLDRDVLSDQIRKIGIYEGLFEHMNIQISGDINPDLKMNKILK